MTLPRRWPRQAEECRTGTIVRARSAKRIAERLKGQLANAAQREQVTELLVLLTEIELKMVEAKEGTE